MGPDKQQQMTKIKYSGPNYDPITVCSTIIGGKLLVGFKHMTDFLLQNICSVMQLVIIKASLPKSKAGFNLVITTVDLSLGSSA